MKLEERFQSYSLVVQGVWFIVTTYIVLFVLLFYHFMTDTEIRRELLNYLLWPDNNYVPNDHVVRE